MEAINNINATGFFTINVRCVRCRVMEKPNNTAPAINAIYPLMIHSVINQTGTPIDVAPATKAGVVRISRGSTMQGVRKSPYKIKIVPIIACFILPQNIYFATTPDNRFISRISLMFRTTAPFPRLFGSLISILF